MKRFAARALVCFLAVMLWAPAQAQANGPNIVINLLRKHDRDPMPGTGITISYRFGDADVASLREEMCSGYKLELDQWAAGCAANPAGVPFARDPRPEIRRLTCQDQVALKRHRYDACLAPANSISCSGPGFWATARTARGSEVLPNGNIGNVGEGPAVGGAACGRKSEKAALASAVASCEKTRVDKGLADSKCFALNWGELK